MGALAGWAPALNLRAAEVAPPRPGIDDYVRSPAIEDCALSLDGRNVAFVTKKDGLYYVVVTGLADQKTTGFRLDKKKVRGVFWGDDTHICVLTSVTAEAPLGFAAKHGEYALIHSFDIQTGEEYVLFGDTAGLTVAFAGNAQRIRMNGGYRLAVSNDPRISGRSLRAFDLQNRTSVEIDAGSVDTLNWILTPDGTPVARALFHDASDTWNLEFKTPNGWKKAFSQKQALDIPSLIGLGRSPQTVIIGLAAGDKAGSYFEIGADGVLSAPMQGKGHNSAPLFHPVTGLFCGFAEMDDDVTYAYDDPAMQKLSDLCKAALPDQRVTISEFGEADPRQVLMLGASLDDPGTYYVTDFGKGSFVKVGALYPNLPTSWVAPRTAIVYKAADGLDIHAYLTLPPAALASTGKALPLIVLPHGGPEARDTLDFDWESQLYASRGYAVLQPNFRGSTGYGEAFIAAGYGQWGRKMQSDLSDGITYLAGKGIVDPARVAIVGASYGGYAALAGATFDKGVYRCAVAIAGVSNLRDMVHRGEDNGFDSMASLYWQRFMGDPRTMDAVSPAQHAADCDIPVLMIHGKDDTVVPIDQSRKMRDALKSAHKDVTLIEQVGEDHWESAEDKRLSMYQAIVPFLETHNPPII